MEWLKYLSDRLLLCLLRAFSGFEKELTRDGRAEQALWRAQRLRNLEGLAIRWRQYVTGKSKSAV